MNSLQSILNFHAYNKQLASAGQPTADQFQLIKQAGFSRVINLAPTDSPNAVEDEAKILEHLGIEYIHIPVDFQSPSLQKLEQFFKVMQQPAQKTFVHCALNWRVSCFIYLYRTLIGNDPENDAREDLYAIWQPNKTWEYFIDNARSNYRI